MKPTEYRKEHDRISPLLRGLTVLAAVIVFGIFLLVFGYILWNGIPELAGIIGRGERSAIFGALATTVYLLAGVLLLAVPVGVGTAVWLTEVSGHTERSRVYQGVNLLFDTMNGMPSILYGLFGFVVFVGFFGFGYSLLSGIAIMTVLVLPVIVRTSEEAIRSVPKSLREGAAALGIGRFDTLRHLILPQAAPGIAGGVILIMGQAAGSAAALLYTAGSAARVPENVMDSGRTLAVHMYSLCAEDVQPGQMYAAAVLLMAVTCIMNELASHIMRRWRRGR